MGRRFPALLAAAAAAAAAIANAALLDPATVADVHGATALSAIVRGEQKKGGSRALFAGGFQPLPPSPSPPPTPAPATTDAPLVNPAPDLSAVTSTTPVPMVAAGAGAAAAATRAPASLAGGGGAAQEGTSAKEGTQKEIELENQVSRLQAAMSSIAAAAIQVNRSANAKAAQAVRLSQENQRLKKEIEELEQNSTQLKQVIIDEAMRNVTEARQQSEALRSEIERVTEQAQDNVTAATEKSAAEM